MPLTDFRVTPKDKARALRYYARHAVNYTARSNFGFFRHLRRREQTAVLRLAALSDAGSHERRVRTLIDVGCGSGVYALAAKSAGFEVSAIDAAPEMINRLAPRVDHAEVVDLEQLHARWPLKRRFDVVICAGVLDFVLQPELAFRNLAHLVAANGTLVVLAPLASAAGAVYRIEKRLFGISVNLYTLDWFRKQSDEVGLSMADWVTPLPMNVVVSFRPSRQKLERPLSKELHRARIASEQG